MNKLIPIIAICVLCFTSCHDPYPGYSQKGADVYMKLHRIGDAVSSRNIHAAVFDALRLVKDL